MPELAVVLHGQQAMSRQPPGRAFDLGSTIERIKTYLAAQESLADIGYSH